MKIRWTSGSLRFRISPSELEQLRRGEVLCETLTLGGGAGWHAVLCSAREAGSETGLEQRQPGEVCLTLSVADLHQLATPEVEGVYFRCVSFPPLRFYVEKDFPCVHPGAPEAEEVPGETFAPPPGFKARHTTGNCG